MFNFVRRIYFQFCYNKEITKKWDTAKSALHSSEAGPRCNCTLVVTTLHFRHECVNTFRV